MEPGSSAEGEALVPQGSGDSGKRDNHMTGRRVPAEDGPRGRSARGEAQRPPRNKPQSPCLEGRGEGCCHLLNAVTFLLSASMDVSGAALWETRVLGFPWHPEGSAGQWAAPVQECLKREGRERGRGRRKEGEKPGLAPVAHVPLPHPPLPQPGHCLACQGSPCSRAQRSGLAAGLIWAPSALLCAASHALSGLWLQF